LGHYTNCLCRRIVEISHKFASAPGRAGHRKSNSGTERRAALIDAVDQKLEELEKFAGWWGANVSEGHGGNRKQVSGARYLKFTEAEELTGMKQPRVSDLKRDLKDVTKFRNKLLGKEYVAAHLEAPHVRCARRHRTTTTRAF
jgi:hypothetical protein